MGVGEAIASILFLIRIQIKKKILTTKPNNFFLFGGGGGAGEKGRGRGGAGVSEFFLL